jgi:hypothetical protein
MPTHSTPTQAVDHAADHGATVGSAGNARMLPDWISGSGLIEVISMTTSGNR